MDTPPLNCSCCRTQPCSSFFAFWGKQTKHCLSKCRMNFPGEIPYNQDSLGTWTNKWGAEQLWSRYSIHLPAALYVEGHTTLKESIFSPFFHNSLFLSEWLHIRFPWESDCLKFTWWGLFVQPKDSVPFLNPPSPAHKDPRRNVLC